MYMKLLLVDSRVQYQQIVDARKDDVDYIVFNYRSDTFKTVLDKINANKYTEIGLVQHTFVGFDILARETIGDNSDLPPYPSFNSLKDFLIGLKNKGISIFDFLGCDLYDPEKTPAIFEYLEEQTGVDLRASTNLTGNKTSGGDWILESDNVDVKNVYFTDKIDEWKGTLLFLGLWIPNDRIIDISGNVMYLNVDISGFPINPIYDASGYNVKYPNSSLIILPYSSGNTNPSYVFSRDNSNIVAVIPGGGYDYDTTYRLGYAFAALKADGSVVIAGPSNSNIIQNVNLNVNNYVENASPLYIRDLLSSGIVSLYATAEQIIALKNDGSLIRLSGRAADANYYPASQLSYVVGVCPNSATFACLRNDGSVFIIGGDDSKSSSTIGPPLFLDFGYYLPPNVKSKVSSGVVSISATATGFYALKSDGTVAYWGENMSDLSNSYLGYPVHSGWENTTNIVKIFNEAHCGLKADGSLDLWLQMESTESMNFNKTYLQNHLSSGVKAVYSFDSYGYTYAALKQNGSVIAWGLRQYGGDLNHPTYGIRFGDVSSGVVAIYPNVNGAFAALKKDGSVVYWGAVGSGPIDLTYESTQLSSGVIYIYPLTTARGFIAVKNNGSLILFNHNFGNNNTWNNILSSNKKAIRFYNSPIGYNNSFYAVLREDGSIERWNDNSSQINWADSSNCAIHLVSNIRTNAALIPSPPVSLADYYYPTGGINVKSLPNQPILNTVIYTGISFQLSWSAYYLNSNPNTYYVISDGINDISMNAANGTSYTYIYTDSSNGMVYNFSVVAGNIYGESLPSNIVLRTLSTLPNAPTLNSATPNDSKVVLSWTPNTYNGGSPVIYYLISKDGGNTYDISMNASTGPSYICNDLSNGVLYKFAIKSGNAIGVSSSSNLKEAIPSTVPSAPSLNNPVAGNLSISLSWSEPTQTGGSPISSYNIYISGNNSISYVRSVYPYQRSYLFTDISSGDTQWSFYIKAVNSAGEGSSSATLSNYGRIVPEPPILDSITLIDNSVVLNWTPPTNNGGSVILRYNIIKTSVSDPNQQDISEASNTDVNFTYFDLPNGASYAFRIQAVNIVGGSRYSNYLATTIGNVPTPPTLNKPILENGNINLSWSAPTSNGGSDIQNYIISTGVSPDITVEGTSYSFTGLTNITYTFQVRAVNLSGPSDYSNPRVFTIN